jgi:polyisoprenyl-phosphate glycosyltransferase
MTNDILYNDIWDSEQIEEAKKLAGPILIVGVSGFIGSKLYFSLKKIRDDVFGCSKNPKHSWRLIDVDKKHLFDVDITDYERLRRLINNIKPMTVFNLAAYGAYSRQTDSQKIHRTNYIGTHNLIKVLLEYGCSAFVHAGSSSEYGVNCSAPKENDELIPNSDYAVSKAGAAYLIKYYGKFHSFPCVNLRLYSIFGPWEERDRLIPTLITNCLQGKLPSFVDKDISRDFLYIDDCTNAFVKAALTVCQTHMGESINIASGKMTSLEEVAFTAKKIFNISDEPVFGSMQKRKWDLRSWYGDSSHALSLMGWQHKTTFAKGLQLTADWEREAVDKIKHIYVPQKIKTISAVIACYKDNQSIPILYERLVEVFRKIDIGYEIIFVNDCSPYNDEEVIKEICMRDSHVVGISHSRNFGSQSAFISGLEIASGDAVVLMDGDGQDPPELIDDFAKKWNDGYDIVYGERVKRDAPVYMQIFYKLFYRIFKKLSDIDIPVDAGDFSLIDRKAVDHLLKFTEKDVFLRGLRAWVGFKQIGVPYNRPERLFGKSTNNFSKNIWWAKKAIYSFSTKPLQYMQTFGVIMFFVTIGLSSFYLIYYFINPLSRVKGISTIVLLLLGLGSIQMIFMSILGDYLGKVVEEVKNRPKFIRNKIIYNGEIFDNQLNISKIIDDVKNVERE